MFQRPQHLLTRAAESYTVIFFEEPIRAAAGVTPRLERYLTPQGVLVARPVLPQELDASEANAVQSGLLDGLLEELGQRPAILWYYSPMFLPIAGHLRPVVTVYDCMDELSLFQGASVQLQLLERRLLKAADLVFAGGRSLYEAKRFLHPSVHLCPSSVDAGHFGVARGHAMKKPDDPADQAALPRPRLGYFGVIDERMDLQFLATLADARPDWQIVMIGPVVKIDPGKVPQRPNLHWLGARNYTDLPAYLAHWDVGLMPFALNESTRFISPTKTPEFLSAGVPVVSTPIRDVVRDWGEAGPVEIAATPQAAIAAAEAIMARPAEAWLDQVDRRLASTSWDRSWGRMNTLVRQLMDSRQSTKSYAV